jgi:RNA polymerase sigma-70 factor (ECF subfamily)
MALFGFTSRKRDSHDPEFATGALAETDALYRTALRLTRDRSEAEDLVQDTFVKAFRSAARFTRGTNLRAWLFTILMNTWRNRRRDAGRDPVDVDSELVERAGPQSAVALSPEDLLLRSTLDASLRSALDRLPEAFRAAVWLRDVEDFSYAEIARMLSVPIGTVMSRISRGRRQLHALLTTQTEASPFGASGRG